MRAILAILFTASAASAIGSGPYLPSGWRPKGPAFLLPMEDQKSEATTSPQPELETKETPQINPDQIIQESEASGSDFLREYGPPDSQDILKTITEQALPDTETERAFAVIDVRIAPKSSVLKQNSAPEEVNNATEAASEDEETHGTESSSECDTYEAKEVTSSTADAKASQEVTTTETVLAAELVITEGPVENKEKTTTTANVEETSDDNTVINDSSLEYLPLALNEIEKTEDATPILKSISSDNDGQINDIASLEYLPPVENEAEAKVKEPIPLYKAELATDSPKTEQESSQNIDLPNKVEDENASILKSTEDTVENVEGAITKNIAEEKTVEESSGQEPVSDEQEPIGFREYGPPKKEAGSEAEKIQNNETRKRRFLSKFSYRQH